MTIKKFQKIIWDYYKKNKRELPWRKTRDPYRIWISEVMLQQTQVGRVIPKYEAWLKKFPSVLVLSKAAPQEVLKCWQGLGYNRRGLNLWKAAKMIVAEYNSKVPTNPLELERLPGVGHYTARAISTFAGNKPHAFIETNIRSVFIHSFFGDRKEKVDDAELMPFIEKTVDSGNPREWYWALMDYGAMLKTRVRGINARASGYKSQSAFKGSHREVRSAVLRVVLKSGKIKKSALTSLPFLKEKIQKAVLELMDEGFIIKKGDTLYIHHGR